MTVCYVTDRRRLSPDARTTRDELRALTASIDEAAAAGVDWIQIRERDLSDAALVALVRDACHACTGTPASVLVNDRADAARAAQAGGVHLRADGPPAERIRRLGPPDWIVGRAVHAVEDVHHAGAVDYVMFGAVFPSGPKPAQGTGALRAVVEASTVPVLAIGGIDASRAAECARAGAAGVAAIGLFLPEGRTPEALGVSRAIAALRAAFVPY